MMSHRYYYYYYYTVELGGGRILLLLSLWLLILMMNFPPLAKGYLLLRQQQRRMTTTTTTSLFHYHALPSSGTTKTTSSTTKTTNRRQAFQEMMTVAGGGAAAAAATTTARSSLLFVSSSFWLIPAAAYASDDDDNNPTTTTTTTTTTPTPDTDITDTTVISIPLEFVPTLSAYVIHFYLFGERFGSIVDTGSPFLTVPSTCNKFSYKYRWGCYKPELTLDSGYTNTIEGFDNNIGTVVWRKAPFSFFDHINDSNNENDDDDDDAKTEVVFGVFGPALLDGPGGVFFGLIKDTDRKIRPSFLGQTDYQSFCVDLRSFRRNANNDTTTNNSSYNNPATATATTKHQQQLILSKRPLINNKADYIPLVKDLSRRYGAPVNHYHAKASGFVVNGLPLRLSDRMPTYVIFDTGVTGMVVSQELFDGRYLQARKNREKNLWGKVRVSLTTNLGSTVHLVATKPITTPLGSSTPWKRFRGNLIVLGLAFLDGLAMTIDINDGKLQFSD